MREMFGTNSVANPVPTLKYSRVLQFVVILFLLGGLIIPFIGYRFGVNPDLNEIMRRVIYRMSDLSYPIIISPFIILSGILLFIIWKESKKQEMTESQFISHFIGFLMCFIPCCWCESQFSLGRGAPQGPVIFLFPLLTPVAFYFLYKLGYLFARKIIYLNQETKKSASNPKLGNKSKTLEEMLKESREVKKTNK